MFFEFTLYEFEPNEFDYYFLECKPNIHGEKKYEHQSFYINRLVLLFMIYTVTRTEMEHLFVRRWMLFSRSHNK